MILCGRWLDAKYTILMLTRKLPPSRVIMSLESHVYCTYISCQVKGSYYWQTRKSTELPWKPYWRNRGQTSTVRFMPDPTSQSDPNKANLMLFISLNLCLLRIFHVSVSTLVYRIPWKDLWTKVSWNHSFFWPKELGDNDCCLLFFGKTSLALSRSSLKTYLLCGRQIVQCLKAHCWKFGFW